MHRGVRKNTGIEQKSRLSVEKGSWDQGFCLEDGPGLCRPQISSHCGPRSGGRAPGVRDVDKAQTVAGGAQSGAVVVRSRVVFSSLSGVAGCRCDVVEQRVGNPWAWEKEAVNVGSDCCGGPVWRRECLNKEVQWLKVIGRYLCAFAYSVAAYCRNDLQLRGTSFVEPRMRSGFNSGVIQSVVSDFAVSDQLTRGVRNPTTWWYGNKGPPGEVVNNTACEPMAKHTTLGLCKKGGS
ncbi:hypothetical protein C8R45DRAFT_938081 [Mycena sanguinolenta]|nr:hypothetical protein C8R45DRAFT_938081 [Mycena sanguinolenta]